VSAVENPAFNRQWWSVHAADPENALIVVEFEPFERKQ